MKKGFFYFEFLTDELAFKDNFKINESSKFPSIQRDLSFLVPKNVNFDEINKLIFQQAGKDLISLKLFDLYENKEVKNSSSSFAINMTWQSKSKTLEDKAIDLITLRIIKKLRENLGIHIRQ